MSARTFAAHRERHGPSFVNTYRLTCSACGVTGNCGNQDIGAKSAKQLIAQKFERKGWTVGRRPDDDLCPSCTALAERRSAKLVLVSKEDPMPEPVKLKAAEAPRQPTREEKRICMEFIRERYDEKSERYLDGWTDHKIATDLNVPRAWVAEIRDEWFGAEGGNAEIDKLLAETDKLRFQLKDTEERYGKELTALANSMTVLMREVSVIRKAVGMK